MSIVHHPSEALLLDYGTGALNEGWSLTVATHLALCPACRAQVAGIEAVGGSLLETLAPTPVAADALDAVLGRLDEAEMTVAVATRPAAPPARIPVLPEPLHSYVGGDANSVPWQRLGRGAYQYLIPLPGSDISTRLLRIPAGRPVPEHSHRGLELTMVLCGAFSDATGLYGRGDIQEAGDTLLHQPHAAAGEDCICLAATEGPLRFTSLAARMVQPLLGI
jgi:putative transcriptional regulator